MTLDKMLAEAKRLSNEDLDILMDAMLAEQKDRKDRIRKAAWTQVCDAIAHYTAHYGSIRVVDYSGDEDTEITLYFRHFAFSEYGDIEVGV